MASTSEANQARAIATTTRLKNFTQAKNIATTTPLTTSTLLQHEHGGGAPGEIKTMIAWQVRISNKPKQIDQVLGSGARKIANSIYLFDYLKDVLATLNLEWTRTHAVSLTMEDVSIRFHGNKVLEPNTTTLTIGEFYSHYSSPSRASIYIDSPPKVWSTLSKAKSPLLCLEIFIDYESWFVRAHDDAENQSILNVAKPPKRARVESTITAPDRSKQARKSNRAMKVAYELEILTKPETFVAKRFFRLDDDSPRDVALSTVSVLDNKLQIKAELVRLGWGNWFLNDFYKHCDQTGVTVCRNIAFADAFLAQEIACPSTASGVQAILEDDDGIMWLVEPKRPSSVLKFSGTLGHRTHRKDQRSQTIYAFAHFVLGHSNHELVFADIQGMHALIGAGTAWPILIIDWFHPQVLHRALKERMD
ncbi:hypothetical protein HGRIS_004189 [Hohenbuehelia grisea]|uniref:Alpha-type protein kinase domain-containing protein n=1 Tax=Hohenbuehelia grisea TaxID=104357 RepID=A0ABR3JJH7_9AGAR